MNISFGKLGGLSAGIVVSACLTLGAGSGHVSLKKHFNHKLYVESNATSGNQILIYGINRDGTLTYLEAVSTGGNGNGGGLGQGAISFADGGRALYAVNAGSNSISFFRVDDDGLTLLTTIASGGTTPISVTAFGNIAYVLNAGGTANITGFRWWGTEGLRPIKNSTEGLSTASPTPVQIGFNNNGTKLVVTEKGTNKIDVFPVDEDGKAGKIATFSSVGATPFGFAFGRNSTLVVSEANGGIAGASSATSYHLSGWSNISPVSSSVPTNQTAACWSILTHSGLFAYTADAGSAEITGFSVSSSGALQKLTANGATASTNAHPVDMAVSTNDQFLYVVSNNGGAIDEFEIQADGSLVALDSITGLPTSISGAVSN